MTSTLRAKICRWIAAIYLVWGLLVYFGTLGGDAHSWWPIFLYRIIWPLSAVIEFVSKAALRGVGAGSAAWIYFLNDAASGFVYIVGGTLWVWLLATIVSKTGARVFRL